MDVDATVEAAAGLSIAALIESRGEKAFRDLEAETLARLISTPASAPRVLACGAGILGRAENAERLREAAFVAWLRVAPETAATRLGGAPEKLRPMLQSGAGETVVERLRALDTARSESYAAAADAAIQTDGRTASEVAAAVAEAWRLRRDRWERSGS